MENIDRTQEFLKKCQEAGYQRVTIYCEDKRVPISKKIIKQKAGTEIGWYWGNEEFKTTKVVCGFPEQIDEKGFPKMWTIIKECGLTAGLQYGGFGLGDSHEVHPSLRGLLTEGYYEFDKPCQKLP